MNEPQIRPIYIFSLPRSGSTLLQRIVATDANVATTAETWLLLPLLYTLRPRRIYADFAHSHAVKAIEDFCSELPNGQDDYLEEMRLFALRLYQKAAGRPATRYFLDKTPRYHLIAQDIMQLFPEGKFVFLWRNPLAIAASIVASMASGKWSIYRYQIDLYAGLQHLTAAYSEFGERAFSLRYEDILAEDKMAVELLFDYLELDFSQKNFEAFSEIQLSGRYGDMTGKKKYKRISQEPIEKWKHLFCNPLRKRWARSYLEWIGAERLRLMGYELDVLQAELAAVPTSGRFLARDLGQNIYGTLFRLFDLRILKHKLEANSRHDISGLL